LDIAPKTALLLLAVGINALEYLFPRIPFLPWLKPGFANAVTIIWIIRYGTADALLFSAVRTWITSFYFGFSLVSLVLSMSGGLLAAAGMGLLWRLFGRRGYLGLVGLGICGAVLHNIGQLVAIYFILAAIPVIWYQAPFMLTASIVFGALSGLLGYALVPYSGTESGEGAFLRFDVSRTSIGNPGLKILAGSLILASSVGIVLVKSPIALGFAALLATLLAAGTAKEKSKTVFYPLTRFWLLFAFVAVMYSFFSYGRTFAGIPFVTSDGLRETALQWLRLWTWLELSVVLSRLEFNRIVLQSAAKRLPFGRGTFTAALFSLELFPAFIELLKGYLKMDLKRAFGDPKGAVKRTVVRLYGDIQELIKVTSE
jgi:heptaprenyl diphosphate synthase